MLSIKPQSPEPSRERPPEFCEKTFFALGTLNRICAYGCPKPVMDEAVKRVLSIDARMSAFRADSAVSRLNQKAGLGYVRVDAETFSLLNRAVKFSKATRGAFDITVRPLVELWGIGKKGSFVPSEQERERVLSLVNYRDLLLDTRTQSAALNRRGQAVDLGGIAKGYAADEVVHTFRLYGITSALVNLGGNIAVMGKRPDGEDWRIGIQNPLAPTGRFLGALTAQDTTLVTSGSNERFFIKDGTRYHHILDPRTGSPAQSGLLSVTAVCKNSADADALTTALFVLGPEAGARLLKKHRAEALYITEDQKIYATGSLRRRFYGTPSAPGCIQEA